MKTLWIVEEPVRVFFDVKPIHEALGTEKLDSSIEIELTDKEYEEYTEVLKLFEKYQALMDSLIQAKYQ